MMLTSFITKEPADYTEASKYYTTKSPEYYTATHAALSYCTESCSCYYTETPAFYKTESPKFYTTAYAAPSHYTDAPKYYSALKESSRNMKFVQKEREKVIEISRVRIFDTATTAVHICHQMHSSS